MMICSWWHVSVGGMDVAAQGPWNFSMVTIGNFAMMGKAASANGPLLLAK